MQPTRHFELYVLIQDCVGYEIKICALSCMQPFVIYYTNLIPHSNSQKLMDFVFGWMFCPIILSGANCYQILMLPLEFHSVFYMEYEK